MLRIRKIRQPFVWVLALIALVANTAVAIYNVNELLHNEEEVDRKRRVLAQINLVLSKIKDAETGQRGFLITNKEEYLEPYHSALSEIDSDLAVLEDLTADDPQQQSFLKELRPVVTEKISEMKITIDVDHIWGNNFARNMVSNDFGRLKMQSIRDIIDRMTARENQLLADRAQLARTKFRTTMITAMIGGVLTLGMTGLAFMLIRRELTLRRKAEGELRQNEKELRLQADELAAAQRRTADTLTLLDSFLSHAPIGLAFLDAELRFVRINQYLLDRGGMPAAVDPSVSLMHGAMRIPSASVEDLRYVLRTRKAIVDRLVVDSAPGNNQHLTWQTSYYPILSPDDELLGVGLITRDITTRLRNERALRESQARFRDLAESMPQFVWVARQDGYHEYFNQRWYDYTGKGFEQSTGFGWTSALHPEDKVRAEEHWKRSLETEESFEIEYRIRNVDGRDRWFLARGLPQRNEFGRIVSWFGTATDIHDRKEFEDELRRSIERFRLLTEAIPQMVWTSDPRGKIEYYNQHWIDYTGLGVQESNELGWNEVIHPDDREHYDALWQQSVKRGIPHEIEMRVRRASSGEYRWHVAVSAPMREESGRIVQWVGTLTDIHDRKCQSEALERMVRDRTQALSQANTALNDEVEERRKAEEKERESAGELRRSNQELEQFAYVASHDLQEPLRKIQAFGDRLQQKFRGNLGDLGQQYLDRITASATRMRSLINDLLSFSRVATHPQPFEDVDLAEIVRGVLFDLDERVLQTQGTIQVGALPHIEAAPLQMRQLFQNLIGNALKFHKPDVPPVINIRSEVFTEAGHEPDQYARELCRIEVSDNGIGFDDQYRERIFQIFQRLHGRNEYEGTGIGLAICRKIVERHSGTLVARSVLGEGSTFEVILPIHQSSLDEVRTESSGTA